MSVNESATKGSALVGAESGLYKITATGTAVPLWTECRVSKIVRVTSTEEQGASWFFLTAQGVLFSSDLKTFEFRNEGLPFLTMKEIEGDAVTFRKQCAQLKDLEAHPQNGNILVTATKDNVYITYDAARSWKSLGSMSSSTSGIKAVAVASMNKPKKVAATSSATNEPSAPETELAVFMAHTIFGFSYILPNETKPAWKDCNGGFESMPSQSYPDEIADILPVVFKGSDGFPVTEVFVSQTFLPRLYRFDWQTKRAVVLYSGTEPLDTIDGLSWSGSNVLYTRPGEIAAFDPTGKTSGTVPQYYYDWKEYFSLLAPKDTLYAAWIPSDNGSLALKSEAQANSALIAQAHARAQAAAYAQYANVPAFSLNRAQALPTSADLSSNAASSSSSSSSEAAQDIFAADGISLSELWLLRPEENTNAYTSKAWDKKSIYCPANHVTTQSGIEKYRKTILDNKLNSLVIDMKDDFGLLRFDAKDPVVLEKAYISRYHVDLDHFVSEFKKDNIYLIARVVVFKDKNLSQFADGKYAVWNWRTNTPWIGIKGYEDITDEETGAVTGQKTLYYDENWVDPYSPDVWDYNVRIAKELIERGFDEIQFDYIRFPTDGKNMGSAQFRWKSNGMDKESALLSFLAYARKNINAPIGIDIYGANGWYRSGTRTGQDVEQLSDYIDVVCPMFYPSHFEQSFLNYAPVSERPYRIFYYGTYRNTVIGRNRIIIRPWVQAFYLGVSYDRQWYNSDYVSKEVFGVRDSVNSGYMYWNNIGRYDDISPDPGSASYSGSAPEASDEFRKPALSSQNLMFTEPVDPDSVSGLTILQRRKSVSILDTIRKQEHREAELNAVIEKASFLPSASDIKRLWQNYSSAGTSVTSNQAKDDGMQMY